MDCLTFWAEGRYGQFRKPYTTTSSLTFFCIPPTAVKGLVGAVLGIDRSELHKSTLDMKVGISVLTPVEKDMQCIKLLTMKKEAMFHFPANMEFLRNLKYELCIAWDSTKLDALETALKDHTPVYTPSLGMSEHIAKLTFLDRCEAIQAQDIASVDSIVPVRLLGDVRFSDYDVFVDEIPVAINKKREYTAYEKVVFVFKDGAACSLNVNSSEGVFRVGDRNIFFF